MTHIVYVIAEIGINHEGDVETCGKMIRAAMRFDFSPKIRSMHDEGFLGMLTPRRSQNETQQVHRRDNHRIFKEQEAGMKVTATLTRKHGASE